MAPLVARRLMYLEPSLWPLLEMLRSSASIPADLVTQLRGLPEAGRGGGGSGDSRFRFPAAVPSLHKLEVRGRPGRSSSSPSYPCSRACRGPGCGLSTSATHPALGYLRCSRPLSASPPKIPPRRSTTPAASGRRPNPPVRGSTAAPYWAPAAPYWYWAAAYWYVAAPCAIAGAATSNLRRASIVARYTALFYGGRRARRFQGAIMSKI